MIAHRERRLRDAQLRLADRITAFAGSMPFVYIHTVIFAAYRQSEFAQAKADHDFVAQEQELRANTDITRAVHALLIQVQQQVADRPK